MNTNISEAFEAFLYGKIASAFTKNSTYSDTTINSKYDQVQLYETFCNSPEKKNNTLCAVSPMAMISCKYFFQNSLGGVLLLMMDIHHSPLH